MSPADSGPVPDSGVPPADAAKVLPWVSTLAGSECGGEYKEGKLLEAKIGAAQELFLSPEKRLFFTNGSGNIWVIEGDNAKVFARDGPGSDDGPIGKAGFGAIYGLAAFADGSIYVAETIRLRLVKDGQVTTIAGSATEAGHVDGPGLKARFAYIHDMTMELDGGLLIGDRCSIRRYKDGQVTTLAGKDKWFYPQDGPVSSATIGRAQSLVSAENKVYFADQYMIRVLENGYLTTLAGQNTTQGAGMKDGPASEALFKSHLPSITWHQDAVYVADRVNNRIRKLEKGQVSSLNSGKEGLKDGPLSTALFDYILSVVTDAKGNLLVGDAGNCRIRYIELH